MKQPIGGKKPRRIWYSHNQESAKKKKVDEIVQERCMRELDQNPRFTDRRKETAIGGNWSQKSGMQEWLAIFTH